MPIKKLANGRSAGIGVDAYGGHAVDPSENVRALNDASVKAISELVDEKVMGIERVALLRAEYQQQLDHIRATHSKDIAAAEAGRLDAIRRVDREEVAKTAAVANLAAAANAKLTTDLATTLQHQVTTTADAAEARRSADMAEIGKRVSALELSSSEGKGKRTVADPQLAEALAEMRLMAKQMDQRTGKTEGVSAAWLVLLGAVSLIATLLAIGAIVFNQPAPAASAPTIVYVPVPPGTQLPSTPPATVPR